eukprot:1333638-Amorphochlora_amoeboformis.AAC.1
MVARHLPCADIHPIGRRHVLPTLRLVQRIDGFAPKRCWRRDGAKMFRLRRVRLKALEEFRGSRQAR